MHCTKLHKNLYSVNTHANNGHYKTDTCCKKSSFMIHRNPRPTTDKLSSCFSVCT